MIKYCSHCGANLKIAQMGRGGPPLGAKEPGVPGKGAGPGGKCICLECDYEEEHIAGEPCLKKECPECGAKMVREPEKKKKKEED